MAIERMCVLTAFLVAWMGLSAQESFTVSAAIHKAWRDQSGLKAGRALAEGKR